MRDDIVDELPIRKNNRLANYDYDRPGMYFLTICTKNRRNILSKIVGDGALDVPKIQLTYYGKVVEKYIVSSSKMQNISIAQYVIMPNHIHLLVKVHPGVLREQVEVEENGTSRAPSPTNKVIFRFVGALKRFCTIELGESLFQRSFHDHIVRDQSDYEHIWNYIVLNPAHWKDDCFYNEGVLL